MEAAPRRRASRSSHRTGSGQVVYAERIDGGRGARHPAPRDRYTSGERRRGTRRPRRLCRNVVDIDRVMQRLNPAVAWLLRSPLHPLLGWGLMLVTVTGRRSGRIYTIPVGYQRDGAALVVLVSKPSRKQWWRNYRDRRPIGVWLRGRAAHGHAVVVAPGSS